MVGGSFVSCGCRFRKRCDLTWSIFGVDHLVWMIAGVVFLEFVELDLELGLEFSVELCMEALFLFTKAFVDFLLD